jgi:hypothetical protein
VFRAEWSISFADIFEFLCIDMISWIRELMIGRKNSLGSFLISRTINLFILTPSKTDDVMTYRHSESVHRITVFDFFFCHTDLI